MSTSIRSIQYTTGLRPDLVRFYREGLDLGDPSHAGGEESFRLGDLSLSVNSGDAKLRAPVPRISLTFAVDDLEASVEHLKAIGVPFDVEPKADGSGERRAVCRDPDGNFVVLVSGPRVARRRNEDDGRPSRPSRRGKKSGAAKRQGQKAKTAKKKKKK